MIVDEINIKDLNPAKYNPRTISVEEFEGLVNSIKTFGFVEPLVINKDLTVIGGHQRLEAAKKLGLATVPCHIVDLDKKQEKKLNVILNSQAISGKFDELKLSEILEELKLDEDYFDLRLDQLETIDLSETVEVKEDDFTQPKEAKYKVELGDIFQLGEHRLMCGDSTKIEDVERLMNGEKADMVFTDPPYGYSYESNHQKKHKMLMNDEEILSFLPLAYLVTEENAPFYICGGWQTIKDWIIQVEDSNLKLKNIIIWKKNNWSMGDLTGAYAGQYEVLFFAHKGRVIIQGKRDRDIWEFDREVPTDHPTKKPVELMAFAINNHNCSKILDLFGGSGSTLIACEQLNRKCYMMELDPYYCSIIIERWEKLTGKKHKKL